MHVASLTITMLTAFTLLSFVVLNVFANKLPLFAQQHPETATAIEEHEKEYRNLVDTNTDAFVPVEPVNPNKAIRARFKDLTLLVFGGARGIGRATAIRGAREGARVVVADLLQKEGNATIASIVAEGFPALFVHADVRKPDECERAVSAAIAAYGTLELAVNCAGIMDGYDPDATVFDDPTKAHAPIHLATDTYWNEVINTNATGTFNCMRAELRAIVKQNRGGAIVNIASVGGLVGMAGTPAYVASKHAVNGLTRNAAMDYAPYGVRVNSVCPAYTTTPMTDTLDKKLKKPDVHKPAPTAYAKSASLIQVSNPRKPPATVWEQAAVILFLLSEDASNMTGACVPVDGGWTTF